MKQPPRLDRTLMQVAMFLATASLADRHWSVLRFCDAIDDESNGRGKSDLKRIVSMLTRLIQRTVAVSEGSIEDEYRDAEDEPISNRRRRMAIEQHLHGILLELFGELTT